MASPVTEPYEDLDVGAGDSDRQNRLSYPPSMAGTAEQGVHYPYGGPGAPGIIFAAVDMAPTETVDDIAGDNGQNIRFAVPGTDTAAKKGDVKLAYDDECGTSSFYEQVDDVVTIYPKSQVWRTDVSKFQTPGAPREPRAPLPIPINAGALGATTPGEVAALALRRIPRVFFDSSHSEQWQDHDVDGRHVIFPRQFYPVGDGAIAPQDASLSVDASIAEPLASQLDVTRAGTGAQSEDYASMGAF